jgi:hypothetical protein
MTHQPLAEELLTHLVTVHGCSEAMRIREEVVKEVARSVQSSSLLPAQGMRQVDVSEQVADEIGRRLETFDRLHDGHHAEQIAAGMLERLMHDELGRFNEHDIGKVE